ncbi:MAG: hypothetical protein HQK77_10185 [Desulfobacterales bacterium]|nr:hypothetical protein [Desulfobacterales bacterium]
MKVFQFKKRICTGLFMMFVVLAVSSSPYARTLSTFSEVNAYQVYKNALKNTLLQQSFTLNTSTLISDQYQTDILSVSRCMKVNKATHTMNNEIQLITSENDMLFHTYIQDDLFIFENTGTENYYIKELNRENINKLIAGRSHRIENMMDICIDVFGFYLKKFTTVTTKKNGITTIVLHMEQNDIQWFLKLFIQSVLKDMLGNLEAMTGDNFSAQANMVLTSLELSATIRPDNLIESQGISLGLQSDDAAGNYREYHINRQSLFSNINSTDTTFLDIASVPSEQVHLLNISGEIIPFFLDLFLSSSRTGFEQLLK